MRLWELLTIIIFLALLSPLFIVIFDSPDTDFDMHNNLKAQEDVVDNLSETNHKLEKFSEDLKILHNYVELKEQETKFQVKSESNASLDKLNRVLHELGANEIKADYFIQAEEEYGVNAIILISIAINESDWGNSSLAEERNNYFGWRAYDRNPAEHAYYFDSLEHSVDKVAHTLSNQYLDPSGNYYRGEAVSDINDFYASDPEWDKKVVNVALKIWEAYMSYDYSEI